ncbi:MAG: rod shape-determining protein MreC [Treponema sp.]|jgi:rod shape-determining protein MreC|nr:rod shape-determining protein MreC [Treponema sp.]MBQ2208257.1 rod shape-determining protein MreC [Treponema sp.]MBQ2356248.1 rod shape-determining protein MreC [Treponema sp.]MBQ2463909.1 rod shape-determining protein MreC [Treponema sp.]MBQ2480441.1 rod shape-determining protein MreC [Treponema sp.]
MKIRTPFRFKLSEILLVVMILTSGIMLSFSAGGFLVDFGKIGFSIMSTMQKGVSFLSDGVSNAFTSIKDMTQMKKEYQALKERLKDYEYLQRSNTEIRRENDRLREQLDFSKDLSYKNIPAQIIGHDPDSLYSGITINKGARNGIRKGMPVIAIQNGNIGVVGKIVTVGMGTSLIIPIYDSQFNISTRVQTSRDLGITKGSGFSDLPLSMGYIRKSAFSDLHEGDVVVTSGENGNYISNVPVGRISKIKVVDYDNSLDIELEPIVDFPRLENVLVVDQTELNEAVATPVGVKEEGND